MSTMKMTHVASDGKSADDLDADADDLAADEAIRRAAAEAAILRLRARAKRLRSNTVPAPKVTAHMTRDEYAERSRVSPATVSRWISAGMPTVPIGTHHRIDPVAADEWRRTRAPAPTTPTRKARPETDDDVDVSDVLDGAGLTHAGER